MKVKELLDSVEEWVKETEKQIYEPEIDPNRPPFVYFPKGLMELNNEFDKEIKRMEKKN